VVAKVGTATVNQEELIEALPASIEAAKQRRS